MKIDRAAEYAGFLLMVSVLGGTLGVHSLLSLPPPQILSLHPYINYLNPSSFPSPSLLKFIDTVLPMVDAILRTGGITSSIHLALTHPTHPQLRSSLFLQLLLGAVASAGGGVLAGTLNVFSAHWSFTTPPFLRSNTPSGSFLGTLDIWSGSVSPSSMDKDSWSAPLLQGSAVQLMTPLEARSVSVIVLTLIYAYRVYAVHYRAPSSAKMDARRIWKNVKSQQGTPVKADALKRRQHNLQKVLLGMPSPGTIRSSEG
ncbi:uncharacterized protein EI90DRAFT_3100093 [Cantharellus anzutake]|uniref:uncharacterized protein n=1 Tax=Cantharellus anzutake TaxID=1750568 RepID=UPI0019038F5F|nr:uncharacterized protein EI90DRAFT_3100093 [Cantharellus anzutake]KAF8310613.1 hypothetical protein EI90DRAFT_3100093 [Cantharellus anzutake]